MFSHHVLSQVSQVDSTLPWLVALLAASGFLVAAISVPGGFDKRVREGVLPTKAFYKALRFLAVSAIASAGAIYLSLTYLPEWLML